LEGKGLEAVNTEQTKLDTADARPETLDVGGRDLADTIADIQDAGGAVLGFSPKHRCPSKYTLKIEWRGAVAMLVLIGLFVGCSTPGPDRIPRDRMLAGWRQQLPRRERPWPDAYSVHEAIRRTA
jgi:hypothetical protein